MPPPCLPHASPMPSSTAQQNSRGISPGGNEALTAHLAGGTEEGDVCVGCLTWLAAQRAVRSPEAASVGSVLTSSTVSWLEVRVPVTVQEAARPCRGEGRGVVSRGGCGQENGE